jgi:chromatin remodeling complex protein RSC6
METASATTVKTAVKRTTKKVKAEATPVVEPVVAEPVTVVDAEPEACADEVPATDAEMGEVADDETALSPYNAILEEVGKITLGVKKFAVLLKDYTSRLRKIGVEHEKEIRALKKGKGKRRNTPSLNADGTKKPNGFGKPTRISPALALFLGVPEDTLVSRTEVTSCISRYIDENSLKHSDGRVFTPDEKLMALLGSEMLPFDKKKPTDKGYSYFNLQSYLKGHFPKAEPVVAATVAE